LGTTYRTAGAEKQYKRQKFHVVWFYISPSSAKL
jgi:hypothetical protein